MAEKAAFDAPEPQYVEISVAASDDESISEKKLLLEEGRVDSKEPEATSASQAGRTRLIRVVLVCIGALILLLLSGSGSSTSSPALRSVSRARHRLLNRIGGYLPASVAVDESDVEVHPILPLLRQARIANGQVLSRQSPTLAAAEKRYTAKYGRSPPPGFAKWWAFARDRNHTLVDEYDGLMNDLRPFESLTAEELRARTATLGQLPGVSIVSIKKGAAQVHSRSGRWAPALAFQEMIENFVKDLPDVDIAINERQEARILPEQRREVRLAEWGETESEPIVVNKTDPLAALLPFRADWKNDGSVWEVYRRACRPDSAARRLIESVRAAEAGEKARTAKTITAVAAAAAAAASDAASPSVSSRRRAVGGVALPPSREVTFIGYPDAGLDVCSRPSLHGLHSAFFSDTRSIPYLYPLFSPSKAPGFADIRIPSHHYWNPSSEYTYDWELKKGRTRTSADIEWASKDNKAFWRGKVTRGADTPEGHSMTFQKQRLVAQANDDGGGLRSSYEPTRLPPLTLAQQPRRVLVALNASSSALRSVSAPLMAINNVTLDVAMACDPKLGECMHQANLGLRVEPPRPLSDVWKHKYALDLDEVGFSPRFFALMESRCAVVKSTIQKEFWSDWAVPWYHYIPLSTSFAELHNIQAFFTGLPQELVDEAAAEGKRADMERAELAAASSSKGRKGAGKDGRKGKARGAPVAPQFVMAQLQPTEPKAVPPLDVAHGPIFDGDAALRGIAEHGAQWRRELARREDMEVYVYRVLIEFSRLWQNSQGVA